jgi:hypothetical protein
MSLPEKASAAEIWEAERARRNRQEISRRAFDIFDFDGLPDNLMMVHMTCKPYLHVERRNYRFRILNASVGRFFKLALSNGSSIIRIGNNDLALREAMAGSPEDPCVGKFLRFRLRAGRAGNVPSWQRRRKDVNRLRPGGSITITMQFRDWTGRFMEHCHNTVHEDSAMLMCWRLNPSGTATLLPADHAKPEAHGGGVRAVHRKAARRRLRCCSAVPAIAGQFYRPCHASGGKSCQFPHPANAVSAGSRRRSSSCPLPFSPPLRRLHTPDLKPGEGDRSGLPGYIDAQSKAPARPARRITITEAGNVSMPTA